MRSVIFQESRGNREESRQKMDALRKETMEKAENLLSADQKKQFKAMLGDKFELKIDPNAQGPGRGPRKGGDKGEEKKDRPKRGDGF